MKNSLLIASVVLGSVFLNNSSVFASSEITSITKNVVTKKVYRSVDNEFSAIYREMIEGLSEETKAMFPSLAEIAYIKVTYESSDSFSSKDSKKAHAQLSRSFGSDPKVGDKRSYTTCSTDDHDFTYEIKTSWQYMYRADSNGDGTRDSNPGWVITSIDQTKVQYTCNL